MIQANANSQLASQSYLTFEVGGHCYAVNLKLIREVRALPSFTAVSHAPDYILGVTSLRGEIVPIVDLRKRFSLSDSLQAQQSNAKNSTLILVTDIDSRRIAVTVDAVNDVIELGEDQLQAIPKTTMAIDLEYLLGMAQHGSTVVLLIDVAKILTPSQLHEVRTSIQVSTNAAPQEVLPA